MLPDDNSWAVTKNTRVLRCRLRRLVSLQSGIFTILFVITILPAKAQEPAKPQPEINNDLLLPWKDVEKNIWANAKPYIDDPRPQLENVIPELKSLDPAASQGQLGSILSGVASPRTYTGYSVP